MKQTILDASIWLKKKGIMPSQKKTQHDGNVTGKVPTCPSNVALNLLNCNCRIYLSVLPARL